MSRPQKARRSSDPEQGASKLGPRCMFCRAAHTEGTAPLYHEQHRNYVSPCTYCGTCLQSYLRALGSDRNAGAAAILPCRNYASCGGFLDVLTLEAYLSAHNLLPPPPPPAPCLLSPRKKAPTSPTRAGQKNMHPLAAMCSGEEIVMVPIFVPRDRLLEQTRTGGPMPGVAMLPSSSSPLSSPSGSPPSSQEALFSDPMETTQQVYRSVLINLVPDALLLT